MQIKIGTQIKELRRKDDRTQDDLANALGVTAQAVSRWEKGICYPDMELMPSMANYFGVSIDELFGYHNEREKIVDTLANKIHTMNQQNNGEDINMDACIRLAREGLVEFPGNEKIMLCLASVLFNAGYVRYHEHHQTDENGYDVYDTEKHKTYAEWQEAITLYEKLICTLDEGELRHKVTKELLQLYVNIGEADKATTVVNKLPDISGCRNLLRIQTCDGQERAKAYGEAILDTVDTCAHLMISSVMTGKQHISSADAVKIIRNAVFLYKAVCMDENYGRLHASLADIHLYLSEHLWRCGDRDGAFDALDTALIHAKAYDALMEKEDATYTSPHLNMVKIETRNQAASKAIELPKIWPCWCIPDCAKVKHEIQADPRWNAWVEKTRN